MSDELKEKPPHTERIFITAEMARRWLKLNIDNNRPIQQSTIEQFKRDMIGNRWRENGSTIVFADTGELIDGQHRLQACMECGVGFWTLVAYSVNKDAFLTIDRGTKRTTGQMLHLVGGVTDYNAIAATLTWLYRFREGIMISHGNPTTTEASELLQANPGLPDSVSAARRVLNRFRVGPVPVVAICHYLFTRQDATLAEAFFDALASGASLREIDPVYQLRARIISASSSTSKRISSYELTALMFKTWIAEREQRTMKQALRWAQAESFPNIGPITGVNKLRPEKVYVQAGKRKGRPPLAKEDKKTAEKGMAAGVSASGTGQTKLDQLIAKHSGLDRR